MCEDDDGDEAADQVHMGFKRDRARLAPSLEKIRANFEKMLGNSSWLYRYSNFQDHMAKSMAA
jgi:hypothetical protein